MRNLLIVRTHRADAASLAAYDAYAALGCFDVVFCCDERERPVDVGDRNRIGFDAGYLEKLGLFAHPACGWRCGDYAYYVSRIAKPDYDFYWMVEPDALIHWTDKRRFFDQFATDAADFLAAKFGPRSPNWGWFGTVKDAYREVYGCHFPLTRISARAIDHCFQARRAAGTAAARANLKTWPNDEAFVSCELFNNGFDCSDLNNGERIIYSLESFRHTAPHDASTVLASPPDNLLYHPVREFADWLSRLDANLQTRFRHKSQSAGSGLPEISRTGAAQLLSVAEALLKTAGSEDAALVPLMLGRHAWNGRAWAQSLPHIPEEADMRRVGYCARLIKDHFGIQDRKVIATAHVAGVKPKLPELRVSSAEDFDLGPAERLGHFPSLSALPYAFDFGNRQLAFTLHLKPQDVLARPFLYAAQRQHTLVVAHVPWNRLDELYGAPDAHVSPILIFSTGRTGSTLLQAIIRAVTSRTVSEPDTVTQLANNGAILESLPEELRRRLFWHALSPFLQSDIGATSKFPCTIKLRSQANAAVAEIVQAFPRARYVFMLRKRLPWARSTFKAFRMPPETAAGRLRAGLKALQTLAKSPVDSVIVNYEDVVADPYAIVGRLLNIHLTDEMRAKIASAMADDSQASTKVSRERTSGIVREEEEWIKAFDAAWQRVRPAAIIESLGIDID